MEKIEINTKQLDKRLTQGWQDICIGHYSLKLPPELLPLKAKDLRFDSYKLELHEPPKTMRALIRELELKMSKLEVPDGLESVVHREQGDRKNEYLVAYRHKGNNLPDGLIIKGYKNLSNGIAELTQNALDGYKVLNSSERKEQDEWFLEDFQIAKRILGLLEPIKTSGRLGKGYCLNNQIIIRGTHQTDGISAVKFYTEDFSSFAFRITIATYKSFEDNEAFLQNLKKVANENQGNAEVNVWKAKVNGLEGGMVKEIAYSGRGAAYAWAHIESKPYSKRPYSIKIEFKEQLESPYWGKQDKSALDEIFRNILASFYFRG